ncbi:MAG: hypothetical protein ACLQPH_02705 [Acidimicrobiales bacterium]
MGHARVARWQALAIVSCAYLALSLVLWWNVWSTDPSTTTICGCGDPSFSMWFMEFAAHALRTGENPFFTTLLWHPHGINVLDDASQLGLGVPLAPLTMLGGAVLSTNVALTLSPVASALATFILLDHWRIWRPAAFAGGLVYGFSPMVLMNLTEAHFVVAMVPALPLIVLCLDELLLRNPRRPLLVGALLGVLVTFQFFVSSEVLLMIVMACTIGVVVVVARGLIQGQLDVTRVIPAMKGLAAGAVTSLALLAYPVWFAVAGPDHISGNVYPSVALGTDGADLESFFWPAPASTGFTAYTHRIGGYQGVTLSAQYFGISMIALLVIGMGVWRRDRRLWLIVGTGLLFALLSFGVSGHDWTLWRPLAHLPLFENVIPVRLLLVTYLAAGLALAVIADHLWRALSRKWAGRRWNGTSSALVAMLVLAVAIGPPAAYLAQTIPFTAQRVVLPDWFRSVVPHRNDHQVLMVIPAPFSLIQSSLTWQSENHLSFSIAGGDGPGSDPLLAGNHRLAQEMLSGVSASFSPEPVTPAGVAAVRRALVDWGVTLVVLPDGTGLAPYDRPFRPAAAAGLITAALAEVPRREAQAWVWPVAGASSPAVTGTTAGFERCTTGSDMPVEVAASCVLDHEATAP